MNPFYEKILISLFLLFYILVTFIILDPMMIFKHNP